VAAVEGDMLRGMPAAARGELAALLTRCAENLEALPDA
jgi:hypothetical protein